MVPISPYSASKAARHRLTSSAMSGDGDNTYRCGACKTKLLDHVSHADVFHGEHFDAIKCPKCGKYNQLAPEEHHHH